MEEERRRKVQRGRRSREDSPGGRSESSPSQMRESRLCFLSVAKYGEDGPLVASAKFKDSRLFGLVATDSLVDVDNR